MKDFLKYVAATVVGLIVFGIIQFCLFIICIIGMAASGGSNQPSITDNSVLVLKLNGELKDHAEANPLLVMLGRQEEGLSLSQLLKAIKNAKMNDDIKGIYIEAGEMTAEPASYTALRKALVDFKSSKKFIVAYADNYSHGSYYISSVADKVWINPEGMLAWHGMASQPQYLRDFLAKFGVKMQVVKVGTYKSATEQYTEDHMSDANREQVTRYITGVWNHMLADVSKSRNIPVDSLNAYADRVMDLQSTAQLKANKLIDGTLYTDEVKVEIKKLLNLDESKDIAQVSVSTMAADDSNVKSSSNKIAIYYCEGSIVQQAEQGALMGDAGIVGPDVCKDIEALTKDDDVKAVVIRINSGGGSAYASEQMWHQIVKLKEKKPVVVSMGGMAASGGYYMGCAANWIVAEPTTITGSIGIFGTFPDVSNLLTEKLGVKFDEVKTNKHSTMSLLAMARPFSQDELDIAQQYINRGYSLFRKRVADGRKMKTEEVEKIAQGRVWLGEDAIKIKLVDQLGGINEAIEKAAALAKIKDDYETADYPVAADWFEQLQQTTSGGSYLDAELRSALGEYYSPFMLLKTLNHQSPIQARLPYVFNFNL